MDDQEEPGYLSSPGGEPSSSNSMMEVTDFSVPSQRPALVVMAPQDPVPMTETLPEKNTFTVFVRNFAGKSRALVVSCTATVGNLQSMISSFEGIPPDMQTLVHENKLLQPISTLLMDFGIGQDSTIHLKPKGRVVMQPPADEEM